MSNKENEILERMNEMTEQLDKATEEEMKRDPSKVENGDSAMLIVKDVDEVLLGKFVEKFDCFITQHGDVYPTNKVTDKFFIPYNIIQERLNSEAFNKAYNELVALNSEDYKTSQMEDYIKNSVDSDIDKLDSDRQFLVEWFTRNVRNDKIDFKNYSFMMEVLFERDNIKYDEDIDLRNLKTLCFNMYSIIGKISKETYDTIYEKLASFKAVDNNGGIMKL